MMNLIYRIFFTGMNHNIMELDVLNNYIVSNHAVISKYIHYLEQSHSLLWTLINFILTVHLDYSWLDWASMDWTRDIRTFICVLQKVKQTCGEQAGFSQVQ